MKPLVAILAMLFIAPHVHAQPTNDDTTIVLHAVDSEYTTCNGIGGLDCVGVQPTVDVTGFTNIAAFMLLRNYEEIVGVQAAFDVTWTFTFGLWECQSHQIVGIRPTPPFGPRYGTIAIAFDAIVGGELEVIGRMFFLGAGATGCLEIIESWWPGGTHVIDAAQGRTLIPPGDRGRICVGPGGYDACEPMMSTPVESARWGAIKRQYEHQ